jgi:hypothetical protein
MAGIGSVLGVLIIAFAVYRRKARSKRESAAVYAVSSK